MTITPNGPNQPPVPTPAAWLICIVRQMLQRKLRFAVFLMAAGFYGHSRAHDATLIFTERDIDLPALTLSGAAQEEYAYRLHDLLPELLRATSNRKPRGMLYSIPRFDEFLLRRGWEVYAEELRQKEKIKAELSQRFYFGTAGNTRRFSHGEK